MFPLKAVIFDLDGTLIDSHQDIATACNQAMRAVGAPSRTDEEIKSMIGGGVRRLLERALQTTDKSTIEAARVHFAPAYRECLLEQTKLYPGLAEVLDQLKAMPFPMCIATNKPRSFTAPIFEKLELGRWFSAWASADEVPLKKPDPAVLGLALQRAQQSPETSNCIYVGDMAIDVLTARNANCLSIHVDWGYGESHKPKPDLTARTPADLLSAVSQGLELYEKKKDGGDH